MNCQEMSDTMPAVARGEIDWTPAEAAHLAECRDCRLEWAVVAAGRSIASEVTIDADALAVRVLERLRTEPVVKRFPAGRWLAGVAAVAATVLLISKVVTTAPLPRGPAAPPEAPLAVHISGLGDLGASDLTDVLDSFDTSWIETTTTDAPSLDDLDARELTQLQASREI